MPSRNSTPRATSAMRVKASKLESFQEKQVLYHYLPMAHGGIWRVERGLKISSMKYTQCLQLDFCKLRRMMHILLVAVLENGSMRKFSLLMMLEEPMARMRCRVGGEARGTMRSLMNHEEMGRILQKTLSAQYFEARIWKLTNDSSHFCILPIKYNSNFLKAMFSHFRIRESNCNEDDD